jgi:hypothetical protein
LPDHGAMVVRDRDVKPLAFLGAEYYLRRLLDKIWGRKRKQGVFLLRRSFLTRTACENASAPSADMRMLGSRQSGFEAK